MIFIMSARMVRDSGSNSAGGGWGEGATQQRFIRWSSTPEVQPLTCKKTSSGIYTAISRKVVAKTARSNPEKYCWWFYLSSLFLKEIWKNGRKRHGRMFTSAKGKRQKGECKMQTASRLRTIVFRVRKQWHYCCHVLICMVKIIVRSLQK